MLRNYYATSGGVPDKRLASYYCVLAHRPDTVAQWSTGRLSVGVGFLCLLALLPACSGISIIRLSRVSLLPGKTDCGPRRGPQSAYAVIEETKIKSHSILCVGLNIQRIPQEQSLVFLDDDTPLPVIGERGFYAAFQSCSVTLVS